MESAEQAPVQKELELDMEPITPKKHPTAKPTLLEKAKGIFSELSKKNSTNETNFSVRKEPTINFQTENITAEQKAPEQESVIPVVTIGQEQQLKVSENQEGYRVEEMERNETQNTSVEPIKTVQEKLKKPENWSVFGILPTKYRRIFFALLIAVIILLIISWLKPSSDIVQSFEQQKGNSIPTQFQPLNQTQPVEPNILDQLNNPQQKAEKTLEQNQENNNAPVKEEGENEPIVVSAIPNDSQQAEKVNNSVTPAIQESGITESAKVENITTQPVLPIAKTISETAAVAEKPRIQEKSKTVEKISKVDKNKTTEKQVKSEKKGAPVVDAKPANNAKPQQPVTQTNKMGKTLVVPQGTSLMQVFRNNNLNIADVNAMTKAKGAGNALSSFKSGDKVQVSLNSQGRVNELRLSNGSRFIRQTDGSYQFKK